MPCKAEDDPAGMGCICDPHDYGKCFHWVRECKEVFEPVTPTMSYVKHDPVLKPAHYARWKMEPIEFISVNDFPFWLANVIKYACRYDAKDGLQDLYKARAYLDIQIRKLEGHDNFWAQPVATQQALEHAKSK